MVRVTHNIGYLYHSSKAQETKEKGQAERLREAEQSGECEEREQHVAWLSHC